VDTKESLLGNILDNSALPVRIEPFNKAFDLGFINQWLLHYGLEPLNYHNLPEIGFTAFMGITFRVGAVFLLKIEGDYSALLEGLIIDPQVPNRHRDAVLDGLVDRVIKEAKNKGLKGLLALSHNHRVIERAKRFGFKMKAEDMAMTLNLEKDSGNIL
jgi:hypothetical protein